MGAGELKLWENVHSSPCVTFHMSHVMCYVSHFMCQVLSVTLFFLLCFFKSKKNNLCRKSITDLKNEYFCWISSLASQDLLDSWKYSPEFIFVIVMAVSIAPHTLPLHSPLCRTRTWQLSLTLTVGIITSLANQPSNPHLNTCEAESGSLGAQDLVMQESNKGPLHDVFLTYNFMGAADSAVVLLELNVQCY